MAPWSFLKVNYLPQTLTILFSAGLVTCFIVAVLTGHVTPYIPFISDTGGFFPEAGLFSIFLYLSATLGFVTMFVRYLIVDELNKGISKAIDYLNRAAIVIGFIALMGMVVVAAYPETSIGTVHGLGAFTCFVGFLIYGVLQTIVTYKMAPDYNSYKIYRIRLIISLLGIISLIAMIVIVPIAGSEWGSGGHFHWPGKKTPNDKGFGYMVGSAVAEWCLAILFLCYYMTFIREFTKVAIHLRVQLLVEHLDDEPQAINTTNPTERPQILL